MNPRERDTVTSTKSTTKATTGGCDAATLRLNAACRKRRTQDDQQHTPPEAIPHPNKARCRARESPQKSRLGGFFSNMALRLRSSKCSLDSQDNSDNEQTNHPIVDSSKRRKIEPDEGAERTEGSAPIAEPEQLATVSETEEWRNETTYDTASDVGSAERTSESAATVVIPSELASSHEPRVCSPTSGTAEPSSRRSVPRRGDEADRMRKTVQWLEEGSRRLREDLAKARAELHEERRAAKLNRRQLDATVKEARSSEANKYAEIIAELRARISQPPPCAAVDLPSKSKNDFLKEENHRRVVATLKKRLTEAETTIQKLKTDAFNQVLQSEKKIKEDEHTKVSNNEMRKLEVEVQTLRAANKKIEEKLAIAEESSKARTIELRVQHEQHEAELAALRKALRTDTIRMIDEIQSKNREIEKLEKLVNEFAQTNEKLRTKKDETMRKLRENERSQQIRGPEPKIDEKIHHDEDDREVDLCKFECDEDAAAATELERLKELALEQQEVIEVLRQAVKEKERKLEQLSNKRRKEEYYKQWLELEPVAEVDDEDLHDEEEDSALSSAPSSLSPQPGYHNNNNNNSSSNNNNNGKSGVTREAYESLLMEIDEVQTKLLEEQQELMHAKIQVRDLEKALLQETRGSDNSRRVLSEKLRVAEEREARLVAEITELREQNELLEFRVLELEESPSNRLTPDPADSGIVSPEPIHLYKEHQTHKHRDRAVATVIPYTSSYTNPALPLEPQKAPLSLQESGIFEDDVDGDEEECLAEQADGESKLSSQCTQTEAPAGELLQEVQRLQELRARIQERAIKAPEALPPPPPFELAPTGEPSPLYQRIRELEARLGELEAERQLSKTREEELLDENERLAESTYCLEAQLRDLQLGRARVDAYTSTEWEDGEPRACPECNELWSQCDAKLQQLSGTELQLRQQVASLEQREGTFFETLRQADATWAKLGAEYEAKQAELSERLSAQVKLNSALFDQLSKLSSADKPEPRSVASQTDAQPQCTYSEPSSSPTVSKTCIRLPVASSPACKQLDTENSRMINPTTEVAIEAKEVMAAETELQVSQQQPEVLVADSPSDNKQIIYFRWR